MKNINKSFTKIEELCSPRVIHSVGNCYIKLAKVKGTLPMHTHEDEDELNIIINDHESELSYRFLIDENDFTYSAPSCIWIPSNKMHAANAVKGRGTFICVRFPSGVLKGYE